jgi:O-antigen/teichoic acid export membrane protein
MSIISGWGHRLKASSFARQTGWALAGSSASLVLQAAYFALLTRLLGVRDYGIFAGAFALVTIASPYGSLGSGMLFMRYVHLDPNNFATYWGNILFTVSVNSALLIFILSLIAPLLIGASGVSSSLVVLVGISACFCTQLATSIGQLFQTLQLMRTMALLQFAMNLLRLLMVLLMTVMFHHATAMQWAVGSTVATLFAAVVAVAAVIAKFGMPTFVPRLFVRRFREGIGYSLAGSMTTAYNDIDKTMLSHYGLNIENGIYTAAYRLIDIASMPIFSVEVAAMPRFFASGAGGLSSIWALTGKIMKRIVPLGLLIVLVVVLASPLVPAVLGPGFGEAARAVRYLSLVPLFRGIHQIAGGALTGAGCQWRRTAAQAVAVVLNVVLNLFWIPKHGWVGAAWSSIATDGALGAMTLALLFHLKVQNKPAPHAE